jgi:hypothetical protein
MVKVLLYYIAVFNCELKMFYSTGTCSQHWQSMMRIYAFLRQNILSNMERNGQVIRVEFTNNGESTTLQKHSI